MMVFEKMKISPSQVQRELNTLGIIAPEISQDTEIFLGNAIVSQKKTLLDVLDGIENEKGIEKEPLFLLQEAQIVREKLEEVVPQIKIPFEGIKNDITFLKTVSNYRDFLDFFEVKGFSELEGKLYEETDLDSEKERTELAILKKEYAELVLEKILFFLTREAAFLKEVPQENQKNISDYFYHSVYVGIQEVFLQNRMNLYEDYPECKKLIDDIEIAYKECENIFKKNS